ncbi:metallophosphoesterase family protein [Devosia sp. 2618]|uniref:metallophosphoesterase family protein n=1 Tax=Devosia sp. 2618 TaxID=3156454 RepID=UPI0033945E91
MSKTFAIADLHGRFDLMEKALTRIEESYHSGGKVVFLGDYVDRGPASKQVVDRLIAGPPQGWEWVTLKGNHEDMMVACHSGPDRGWWLNNGGDATLESYGGTVPAAHLEWAQRLPMIHADKHRVFVHAAIDPTKPLDGQSETMLLWTRYPENADITYPGLHIVHGHTPHRGGPELYAGRTNLDTGAVFTGRLVVAVFDDDRAGGPVSFIDVTA